MEVEHLDINQLKYFISVAQTLNFTEAARRNGITQPSISHHIGELEKQLGCEVLLETSVDPDLVGGFTLEVGDYLLDASVRRQIETIRRQFVISNNRIV